MKTFVAAVLLLAVQNFPKSVGRVNDFANVIEADVERQIDSQLDQLEQKTSSEVAVVTIRSLEGISIEDYAERLFKQWGVGQAKQNNGVLVLVAVDDHKMRIEVGYGLEEVLPDIYAAQIIRDDFTPRFRENDYSGGIRNGVNHVVEIVEKHQVLTPEELAKFNEPGIHISGAWAGIIFFGPFVVFGFVLAGIGERTKMKLLLIVGAVLGGLPLLLGSLFAGRLAFATLWPLALGTVWLGRRLGDRETWKNRFRITVIRPSGRTSSNWITTGSSSDSSSSSSSWSGSSWSGSSGSDSSFGGGSSGGGGASGSW